MHGQHIWQNGSIVDWSQGTTHVMNPSLHYGIAAFEGIRFYQTERGPAVFRLEDHLSRFFYSMDTLGMPIAYDEQELTKVIVELIIANNMTEGYIRPIAWFSDEVIGLHNAGGTVSIQITLFEWHNPPPAVLSVCISPFRRIHPSTTDVEAKISGHYINTHLALRDATEHGFDDAILLDHEGYIAEASAANIFCIKERTLITPQSGTILSGITRDTIMLLATRPHIDEIKNFRKLSVSELLASDEVFLCGTAYEVVPVVEIDEMPIGDGNPGTITLLLQNEYQKAVHGELPDHQDWLTYVNEK